jgi:nucleoside-diphosphate-sugar epimerase
VKGPRVVITGVAGFIGSNLAHALLAQGYDVVGIDNLSYGVRQQVPDGCEFHRTDIRDPALSVLVRDGDVIVHLAAKNCIADCQDDPVETASINVMGSANVFEAARKKHAAKVIYAESSAMYEGSKLMPTPEHDVQPRSFYAVSKASSMEFAKAYERFYGVRSTALRYFCVYGPRQDYRRTIPPVMSAFIMRLAKGESPTIYGTGAKRRDFIHVDDVNRFHEQCINDSRTDGEVFNLGSGVNYSIRDIYDHVAKLMGKTAPPLHRPDMPGEAEETLADITKARALGWAPEIDLDAGLQTMIDYLGQQGLLDNSLDNSLDDGIDND